MSNEFAPPPREKLFDLSMKPQHDPTAPKRLLDEETNRVADTLIYRLTYTAMHPDVRDPRDGPLDSDLIDTIEQHAIGLMTREGENKRMQLDSDERTFLGVFFGIRRPKAASGKSIRSAFDRWLQYKVTLRYADEYGLTIAEAIRDRETDRAPFFLDEVDNPQPPTEMRHRIARGNDSEFTTEDDIS